MAHILVTGATGFIGSALCARLLRDGHRVRAATRAPSDAERLITGVQAADVGDLGPQTDWGRALDGVQIVFHVAARVHQVRDRAADPLAEYRRVNTAATEQLATSCIRAAVHRLVFVSSVKVNGEGRDAPYLEGDVTANCDPYGLSKREAEELLWRVTRSTPLQVVVVRPPLVYGPRVKANVLSLFKAVDRGVPLPLGAISNRRSVVFVENLVDALVACGTHPAAAGRTYLVSDGQDLSTSELARMIGTALDRPARLVPVPPWMLRVGAMALGRGGAAKRLLESLTVDATRIRAELEWHPPYTTHEGLRRTADWYRALAGSAPQRA
jgi:nucleoside-diphosphate-sugar epimerase